MSINVNVISINVNIIIYNILNYKYLFFKTK